MIGQKGLGESGGVPFYLSWRFVKLTNEGAETPLLSSRSAAEAEIASFRVLHISASLLADILLDSTSEKTGR